jgi:hypothetical protein
MKIICFVLLLLPLAVVASPIYQCESDDGALVYQDQPCVGEALKVINNNEEKHKAMFTQSMVQVLAKLTKKKASEFNDSKKLKAMEVLAMTDAAKSYAFTQVYAISAKHCGRAVEAKLLNYKDQASEVIALGEYYYSQGIEANIDGENFSKSGQDLSAALLEMTQKLDQEHQTANPTQLNKKCKEASQVLGSLAILYSN